MPSKPVKKRRQERFNIFNPKDIPGLILWLDAADSFSVVLNGSTVSQWNDKSGKDYHVTQATANNQPTYVNNFKNGNAVLNFDGVADTMSNLSISATQPTTFFIVIRPTQDVAQYYVDGADLTTNRNAIGQRLWSVNSLDAYAGAGLVTTQLGSVIVNNWMYLSVEFNGASSKFYADGILEVTDNSGTQNLSKLMIGAIRTGDGAYFKGDMAEILIYDEQLTDNERYIVENYLTTKWGL